MSIKYQSISSAVFQGTFNWLIEGLKNKLSSCI